MAAGNGSKKWNQGSGSRVQWWESAGGNVFVCVSRESNIIKVEAVQWKQSGSSGGSGADSGSPAGGRSC